MAAPSTTDDLLDLVRKSGLVDSGRLDAFVLRASADPGPATATHWAGLLVVAGLLTRFQAEQILLGKWRGFTLGRYKVLERLGFGGAGTVYLCEHVKVRRKVAVKVLPTVRANNPAALGRFHREARAAGVLDHPNLVKCHDIDQEGELHYLVMDFVDGASLQQIVARTGPMAPSRAANYIRQAALGLQHAHEAGLVHRDVKPANILVDRAGVVRVLDLGLARFYHDEEDLLTLKYDENNVLGTADYVAPEQAMNSHGVDIRADVYSLGCTFYFLLTGQPPFPGGKPAQKLIAHQVKQPVPVRQLRPEVPAEMADVLAKMVAKNPKDRHQTPAEVAAALEPWAAEPVSPPTEAEMPQLCPAARTAVTAEVDVGAQSPSGLARPAGVPRGDGRTAEPESVVPLLVQQPPSKRRSMAEVETPSAMAAPTTPGAGDSNARLAAPGRAALARRRAVRAAAAVTACAVLGVGLRLGLARLRGSAQPAGFAVHVVSRSGERGAFPSVQEALFHARPGDHVRVADDAWEESLHLTGEAGAGRGVVLEPAGDRPVTWRAPRGHRDDQPLFYASNVPGLVLRNFKFDGRERVKDLVELSGSCPGLTLSGLELTGFTASAVALNDCSGDADRPVTLERLRAVPARTAEAALRFEGRPGEGNHSIHVRDSRLEGPYRSAVVFAGPSTDVEFQHNRFYKAADGLLYRRTTPPALLGLTLASNTLSGIDGVGLHFETSPPPEGSRVTLTNNLFGHTGTLARVDDFFPRPAACRAAWIWVDERRPAGEMPAEQRAFRKTFTVDGSPVTAARLEIVGDAAFIAWVNGERVARGEFLPHLRRVHAVDLAGHLRPGRNVLAVQGTNKTGLAGVLARLTYTAGGQPVSLVSDGTWRSSRVLPPAWQQPEFDDSDWPAAKVVAAWGQGPPAWQRLVWDSVVGEHYGAAATGLFPDPTGNVRDWTSEESYPFLKAVALDFELPCDAADDARFLRYGRASLLALAGMPGVPPEKSSDKQP